jgi:hypothetical protein
MPLDIQDVAWDRHKSVAELKGLFGFQPTSFPIDRIGGAMVSVLASSAVVRGFETRSNQTRLYNWYLLLLH